MHLCVCVCVDLCLHTCEQSLSIYAYICMYACECVYVSRKYCECENSCLNSSQYICIDLGGKRERDLSPLPLPDI